MDNDSPNGTAEEASIDDILADYMDRVDDGEQIDHEEFIAAHPEAADQLRAYFDDAAAVGAMIGDAPEGETDAVAG